MTKPPKCCKEEAVYNEVLGKGFYYCRVCKKEVDAPPPEPDRKYPGMWMQSYGGGVIPTLPTVATPDPSVFDPNDTQAPPFWDKAENEGWQQLDPFDLKNHVKTSSLSASFTTDDDAFVNAVVNALEEAKWEMVRRIHDPFYGSDAQEEEHECADGGYDCGYQDE